MPLKWRSCEQQQFRLPNNYCDATFFWNKLWYISSSILTCITLLMVQDNINWHTMVQLNTSLGYKDDQLSYRFSIRTMDVLAGEGYSIGHGWTICNTLYRINRTPVGIWCITHANTVVCRLLATNCDKFTVDVCGRVGHPRYTLDVLKWSVNMLHKWQESATLEADWSSDRFHMTRDGNSNTDLKKAVDRSGAHQAWTILRVSRAIPAWT